ncbi:MAG TPA: zf-HC2 domain-containing protein [Acidobacteriaceae bacterium]|jgi:hypothetical protein|nr:zf-HC2 domain-containing protein [Acidobacteriaceae bacterium]
MLRQDLHITDEELMLAADGELTRRHAAQVQAHLAACWGCRARMADFEGSIVDFTRLHRQIFDPVLPPINGPRSLLRAQLAELPSKPKADTRQWLVRFTLGTRVAALCVAFLISAAAGWLLLQHARLQGPNAVDSPLERGDVPNPRLTPGTTREATISDLCMAAHEEVVGQVTAPLRQQVLDAYGIQSSRADDYEIDYLIAPGLGGAENIHNLWPEPYTSRTWNAYVKDDLEERLHEMVCARQLDLHTAQRDISTDWVAAYKKYFKTDRPLHSVTDSVARLVLPATD